MKVKKEVVLISELDTHFLPARKEIFAEGLSIIDRLLEFGLAMRVNKNG